MSYDPPSTESKQDTERRVLERREAVEHPNHYGGDVPTEPIKVIRVWGLGFSLGNAVKYIARAGKKDAARTTEDLEKAIFYVKDEVKALLHDGAERVPVVAISEEDVEVLTEMMPIAKHNEAAWVVLRRLHEELHLARARKI